MARADLLSAASARDTNVPAWRVTLDGADLTDRIRPRLIMLSLSQRRDGEADELRLELQDEDGRLDLPKKGALLSVELGWSRGRDVALGLVRMGSFKVDEVGHSGPPDKVTVRARSADLTGDYRIRREESWRDTTLGKILETIAGRNGLQLGIAPELASQAIPLLSQAGKSDMALVRELGRRFDAVATVKESRLIFSVIGRGTSIAGTDFGTVTLTRRHCADHSYSEVDRDQYKGVQASWHDQDGAERKSVHAGETKGAKRLKRTYASEAEAEQAASAEWKRLQRGAAEFDITLNLGRPDIRLEQRVALSGWKPAIDSRSWLVAEAEHSLGGSAGLRTRLKLETAP